MRNALNQNGLALLVLLILLALGGFALAQISNAGHVQHQIKVQQQARQSEILNHIRTSLLGFAGNQGIHSQSHLGHLPCPAAQPDGFFPLTTCLSKPWGLLPTQSKIAVNYLNQGIDARQNELEPSTRHQWQYAVSKQLLQPNALGWSRWVDYNQPAIEIQVPTENNRTEGDIAAVVAHHIKPLGEQQYRITPPYLVIKVTELRTHMTKVQMGLMSNTLHAWLKLVPPAMAPTSPPTNDHENLIALNVNKQTFSAIDSKCSCRCTKTRCTCGCEGAGKWQSNFSCVGNNLNCIEKEFFSSCTSNSEAPCVFSGPAGLQSQWPVSRFEPVAATNKTCRPTERNQCPVSTSSEACTCDFSWPDNTKNDLDKFIVTNLPSGAFQVRPIQP